MKNCYLHDNGWTVMMNDDFDFATASQEDINEIACLLATNTLVVARNQQHLTPQDESRIAHMFGEVENFNAVANVAPISSLIVPNASNEVLRVTGELDEHGEPGLFGHVEDLDWHCNRPADPNRKPLVWLFAVCHTEGSRTSWNNTILAYDDLTPELYNTIKDLKMVCGWKKDSYSSFDFGRVQGGITEDFNEHYTPSVIHTNNGRKTGLFFPFLQFRNFVGMTPEESIAILEPLKDHILQEKYIYHHDWRDGDVIIAEQWLGIHKRWRFEGMDKRILHRVTFDFANSDISSIA